MSSLSRLFHSQLTFITLSYVVVVIVIVVSPDDAWLDMIMYSKRIEKHLKAFEEDEAEEAEEALKQLDEQDRKDMVGR